MNDCDCTDKSSPNRELSHSRKTIQPTSSRYRRDKCALQYLPPISRPPYCFGSKNRYQNGTLVSGKMDQNLRVATHMAPMRSGTLYLSSPPLNVHFLGWVSSCPSRREVMEKEATCFGTWHQSQCASAFYFCGYRDWFQVKRKNHQNQSWGFHCDRDPNFLRNLSGPAPE